MPTLRVAKNDEHLCTVGSDDVWTFSASVWADVWGPELSSLTVTGSSKPDEKGATNFLVWRLAHELKPGDRIAFHFTAGSTSSPIEESPPDEPNDDQDAADYFSPIEEAELVKLESRPVANGSCKWQFSFPGRELILTSPSQQRQHCALQTTWNDRRPDRLRVSLTRSSLREISARAAGDELLVEYVSLECKFELSVDA